MVDIPHSLIRSSLTKDHSEYVRTLNQPAKMQPSLVSNVLVAIGSWLLLGMPA